MLDRRMRIVRASQRWLDDVGSTRDSLIGKNHCECFPCLSEHWKEAHRRGLAGESLSRRHDRFIGLDGKEHWVNWQITPWGDSGDRTGGIIISMEDVTAQIKVKTSARRRTREYRALFANMPEGVAHCRMILDSAESLDFVFLSVNRAFVSLTGLRRVKGRKMSEVFTGCPKIEPRLLDLFRRVAVTGIPEKLELYVAALGQWLSTSTYTTEPGFFVVIFEVVTARRKAESAARQWQHAFEQSGIGISLTNPATDTVEVVNAAAARILGYTPDELAGRPVSDLYSPEGWAQRASRRNRVHSESGRVQFEARGRRKDGSQFPALVDSTQVRDETGKVISNINIFQDLTALKRAEARRRESEQTLRAVLDSAAQAILAVNDQGQIVLMNRAAGQIFGYTVDQLIGQPLERLIPREVRGFHAASHRGYFSSPGPRPMAPAVELRAARKDGTTFPVEVNLSFIEAATDPLSAIDPSASLHATRPRLAVAFVSDISDRKRLEATAKERLLQIQALSASLLTSQEDERRRLSRELHDGLCQQLAFLSIKIGGLAGKSLPGDVSLELKMLQAQAGAAADVARHVAHQLHPSSLDDLGLVVSLQSLCDEVSAENSIPVRFTKSSVPRSVSRETASCFYRIAQQSLRNIAQHAGPCHVLVEISSSSGVVILSIEDDGAGFDPVKVQGRGSLGLTGMQERARLLNGTLCIASRPGQGTRVQVEIPCPEGLP
jgi:PAS domain S-box-containing protein